MSNSKLSYPLNSASAEVMNAVLELMKKTFSFLTAAGCASLVNLTRASLIKAKSLSAVKVDTAIFNCSSTDVLPLKSILLVSSTNLANAFSILIKSAPLDSLPSSVGLPILDNQNLTLSGELDNSFWFSLSAISSPKFASSISVLVSKSTKEKAF